MFDVRIDPVRLHDLLGQVAGAVTRRAHITVAYVNVHCMNVAARDAAYGQILEGADIVYCDGTGVRLAAAILGQHLPERMTGADWIDDLARLCADRGYRLFLLGSAPGITDAAAARLRERYPALLIVGTAPGFGAGIETVKQINAAQPDIVLVGMGTPTQEKWIAQYRSEIEAPVVWAVGALLEFVTGHIPRGPKILTENGLEWLCRLVVEPRKLWRRYLVGNPAFFWRVVKARMRE